MRPAVLLGLTLCLFICKVVSEESVAKRAAGCLNVGTSGCYIDGTVLSTPIGQTHKPIRYCCNEGYGVKCSVDTQFGFGNICQYHNTPQFNPFAPGFRNDVGGSSGKRCRRKSMKNKALKRSARFAEHFAKMGWTQGNNQEENKPIE